MPALLNRGLARRVAAAATGRAPSTTSDERRAIGVSVRDACEQADGAVRAFTGWAAPPSPPSEVVSRIDWVDANLGSIAPLLDRAGERLPAPRLARPVLRVGLSVQLGLLFGYLSRRVIAQYDLFGGERLLFVGPNIVAIERMARVDARDFRVWVAIHEITHRLQFSGVPWLRGAVESVLDRSLTILGPASRSPVDLARRVRASLAHASALPALTEALLTDEQRALLREAQTLMSAVEGHASFVMDHVGATLVDDVATLRSRVDGVRGRGLAPERTLQRAIGLEAKRRQYTEGQAFFEAVAARHGVEAVARVWTSPSSMPTLDELASPAAWSARVLGAEAP